MNAIPPNQALALTHPPYTGPAGRTRTERVRVFRTGRESRELEVFRVVNVEEHPELREAALCGPLHRMDDGEPVDVPFVFHDPAAQQFVLVIPDSVRSREPSERAKLLDSLMKEHDDDVPDYVRHFAIVYGHQGLQRHVEDSGAIEVDVSELEPVDSTHAIVPQFPRLAPILPPAGFAARAGTELALLLEDDALWLFARIDDREDAFSEGSSDLLLQLKVVDQLPVCILTLQDTRSGAVRRAFLNPVRSADGRVLELLRREFSATILVLDGADRLVRSFRTEAPRAANAKMMLQRVERTPHCSAERWLDALDHCRLAPPPLRPVEHPFILQDEARTAAEALQRLELLESWSSPAKTDEALLVMSVPRPVFELSRRRVVADACRFGLAPSDRLVQQAVRFGLAPDLEALVLALTRRFEEIVASPSAQGIDADRIEANRQALARLGERYGTSTGPGVWCNMEHSG